MVELLTSAQMRAIENAAIANKTVTGLELMERAGRGVVDAIFAEWPELQAAPHRAVVLCGPGNNGGDGFVIARLLKDWGWEVEVFLYGDPAKLPPDAKTNYERWCEMGGVRSELPSDLGSKPAVVVDAMFGTGVTRPLTEPSDLYWAVYERWAVSNRSVHPFSDPVWVAVDIPSGLCSDSGKELEEDVLDGGALHVPAHLTVSFHRAKIGHHIANGPLVCGKTVVADIGLEGCSGPLEDAKHPPEGADGCCPAVSPSEIVHLAGAPRDLGKEVADHKYSNGHALVLSGGEGKSGAARLAARGALRVGAGLVTVGAPPSGMAECAAQLTAIMLKQIRDSKDLQDVLEDKRLNALCMGPGMGVGRNTREMVLAALASEYPRGVVLDADALTSFADDPAELFAALHHTCVLTPHGGEFARLFPDIAEALNATPTKGPAYSKVDATRAAAKRAGCVVLFKGPDTVIASPDGRCALNSAAYGRAAPWLATAGSGDVLAGIITGLMARGVSAQSAAEAGAWLHVEAARKFGPGLIAEDLPEQIPAVFRDLGA
ncbi:bifunctional ADP-dependent NAD(P)H-hydrate dehydratase/NAD(P)H-hydrate epimerase [Actibacterium atlanticum]|nr:bifunctional ADP-dependent NAD(P)H-hydrate dehydratase/NAD(P)H-hydrate epimerase [Actibacterium atlanticum]